MSSRAPASMSARHPCAVLARSTPRRRSTVGVSVTICCGVTSTMSPSFPTRRISRALGYHAWITRKRRPRRDNIAPHRQREEGVDARGQLAAPLQLAEELDVGGAALDVGVEELPARRVIETRDVVDPGDADAPQILERCACADELELEVVRRHELD